MTRVSWLTDTTEARQSADTLWTDAVTRGWLPTELRRVLINLQSAPGDAIVRETALSLIAFLQQLPRRPRIEIIDADLLRTWPDVERLDLRAHPRYLVDVACLRDGALVPEAWFGELFVVTLVGVAPDDRLGIRGVLAAQSALLDAPRALDLDVAFAAHRLLRSALSVACGTTTYGDASSESWWAVSPDDVALERAVAWHAGAEPDALPILRHFAHHELPATEIDAAGLPRLLGYVAPAWRVALSRVMARIVDGGRRAAQDVQLSKQNIGRLPDFLRRRAPALARFGRGA